MPNRTLTAPSSHHLHEIVEKKLDELKGFAPTILVCANDDAIAAARLLQAELKVSDGHDVPILNGALQVVESNPYLLHLKPYTQSFDGQRVLIVDRADNTRGSLVSFITQLQESVKGQGQGEPVYGAFVLYSKACEKVAEIPESVKANFFIGEAVENVQIAFPFASNMAQPTAHGEHASGAAPPQRRSVEYPTRRPTPPPTAPNATGVVRSVSSHYVEQILERSVEDQQMVQRFGPTMIIAATDSALPAARLLRNYLHFKVPGAGQQAAAMIPVLTPRLELYDEDANPYLALTAGAHLKSWGHRSLAGQHVLVVDKADSTRSTLATFIHNLEAGVAAARAEIEQAGGTWSGSPVFGVFVLHNKKVDKKVELPACVGDRYFYGEESDDVTLAYPFNA